MVTIEILKLPRASNLEDFEPLSKEAGVEVRYVEACRGPNGTDLLIIPGTKDTIKDIASLKKAGCAERIRRAYKNGTRILGICGGFQMLGTKIIDIKGSEMGLSSCCGFGYFNIVTRLMPSIVHSRVEFAGAASCPVKLGNGMSGFERHTGRTKYLDGSRPLFTVTRRGGSEVEIPDGAVDAEGRVFGTYIHGIFENESFKRGLLNLLHEE